MGGPRDLVRNVGERGQPFLRNDRRLERLLYSVTRLELTSSLYSHDLRSPRMRLIHNLNGHLHAVKLAEGPLHE
jgi:hypothetical protein